MILVKNEALGHKNALRPNSPRGMPGASLGPTLLHEAILALKEVYPSFLTFRRCRCSRVHSIESLSDTFANIVDPFIQRLQPVENNAAKRATDPASMPAIALNALKNLPMNHTSTAVGILIVRRKVKRRVKPLLRHK